MRIGMLGTGVVGRTLGAKLIQRGCEVLMGSRTAGNAEAAAWAAAHGPCASSGAFADAAAFGDLLFNCTSGTASVEALKRAGASHLGDKILMDVSNALIFPPGGAPIVAMTPDESIGERIQTAFPRLRVVKALNTVNCDVMADATRVPGEHDLLICGNDPEAKQQVAGLLEEWFGWAHVIDLGGIECARAMEAYVGLWVRLRLKLGTSKFNIKVVHHQLA